MLANPNVAVGRHLEEGLRQETAWRESDLSACCDTCVPVTEFCIHLGLSLHQGNFPSLPDRSHALLVQSYGQGVNSIGFLIAQSWVT